MDVHCLVFALSCFGIFLFKKWGSCFLKVKSQNSFCQVGRFARKTFCQDRHRHFVRKTFCQDRPALDVLFWRHFVRTGIEDLSGPKYLDTIWTILLRYLGNTCATIQSNFDNIWAVLGHTWAILAHYFWKLFEQYSGNTQGQVGHYLDNTWTLLEWYFGKTSTILWYWLGDILEVPEHYRVAGSPGVDTQGPSRAMGRPTGSLRVKGRAYLVPGDQGVGLRSPRRSWGRSIGSPIPSTHP